MNTRMVDSYLARLKDHERYLEKKVSGPDGENLHFFKKELVALKWAIRYIEDTVIIAAVHQTKWFNEENNGKV